MSTGKSVGRYAVEHKRLIATTIVGITLVLVVLATLPSIWPLTFTMLNPLKIDTDPENMLPDKEPVRVFHDRMKEIMSLNDMIVVGVVDRTGRSEGVFTLTALEKIYALSQFARGLQWRDPQNPFKREGVVEVDMIAPSMVDNVESGGAGVVRFEWLMPQPPETEAQALEVRRKALNIPFLSGTLVSEDGQAVALYLPLTTKDVSYRIYDVLRKKIADPSQLFASEIGSLDLVLRRLTAAAGDQADGLLVRRLWPLLSAKTQEKVRQAESEIGKWQRLLDQHDTK